MHESETVRGHTLLIRTCFEDEAAWMQVVAEATTSGPGGIGPPLELVDEPSMEDWTSRELIGKFYPHKVDAVMFIADCDAVKGQDHALAVVDVGGGHPPIRCEALAVWDVEANLEQDNLTFADLSEEAAQQGGVLRGMARADSNDAVNRRTGRPVVAGASSRTRRRKTIDTLPSEFIVHVPDAVSARVRNQAHEQGRSVEQLVHDHVLADRERPHLRPSTASLDRAWSDASRPFTLRVDGVLALLIFGGAQVGGFRTSEDYCAAVLLEVVESG